MAFRLSVFSRVIFWVTRARFYIFHNTKASCAYSDYFLKTISNGSWVPSCVELLLGDFRSLKWFIDHSRSDKWISNARRDVGLHFHSNGAHLCPFCLILEQVYTRTHDLFTRTHDLFGFFDVRTASCTASWDAFFRRWSSPWTATFLMILIWEGLQTHEYAAL